MQRDIPAFGGGLAATSISQLALLVVLLASVLILVLPQRYLIVPVLLGIFLVPMGNALVVAGVHINPTRLIVLVGWIRLVAKKFSSQTKVLGGGWNTIDTAIVGCSLSGALAFILLWREAGAVINQFGELWSGLGMYILLRFLIRDDEDILLTVKVFLLIAVVNGAEMVYERIVGRNLFGLILGGVDVIPLARDGAFRSQGAFAISILAGTYGVTLVPLLFWLWKSGRSQVGGAIGLVFATVMGVTTGSSTPVLGFGAAILGLCMWPLRGRMRQVRLGIVASLVGLQLVMKAPVWFLLNHVNLIGGSSGYHRAMLIENFVHHFWDWWLVGVKGTAEWGWDMYDAANQFVAAGETGGLLTFILFILTITRAFGALGTARKAIEGDKRSEWLLWSLGATLFAYIIAFLGISLWDQTDTAWRALFAMICAATSSRIAAQNKDKGVLTPVILPIAHGGRKAPDFWYGTKRTSLAN